MEGIVRYGNFSNMHEVTAERPLRVVEMTGDLEIQGGNWRFARINTNGFTLTRPLAGRDAEIGIYLDGVKQDTEERDITEPYDKATEIMRYIQRGGADAEAAYEGIIDLIQADGGNYDLQGFIAAYSALATDNFTYSVNLIRGVAVAVQGQDWVDARTNEQIFTAMQTFMLSNSKARLMGESVDVVRTVT